MAKFQVEQWIPPEVVDKFKILNGWVHFVTQVNVPAEQESCISLFFLTNNYPEYFLNGELIKENLNEFKEVESRLETGL